MVNDLVKHFESHLGDTDVTKAEWPLLRTAVYSV